jgi:hypothetical protein
MARPGVLSSEGAIIYPGCDVKPRLIQRVLGMRAMVALLFAVVLVRTFLFQLYEQDIEPVPEVALREGTADRLAGAAIRPTHTICAAGKVLPEKFSFMFTPMGRLK